MQAAAGAGRIPVDLENEHDSLTCVFPFMEGFRVRVIAALCSTFTKFVSDRKDGQDTSHRSAGITCRFLRPQQIALCKETVI